MYIKTTEENYEVTRKTPRRPSKTMTYTRTREIYHLECDVCHTKFTRKGGMSKKRLSNEYLHACSKICNAQGLSQYRIQKQQAVALARTKIGTIKDSWGKYPVIFIGFDKENDIKHTKNGGANGWVRHHTYLMEKHLGRKMNKGEVVHHIDGDKTNNNLDNLHHMTVAEHNKCHGASGQLVFELIKRNMVKFNRKTNRYKLIV